MNKFSNSNKLKYTISKIIRFQIFIFINKKQIYIHNHLNLDSFKFKIKNKPLI